MSLVTWKAEFYPEDACVAADKGPIEATKHSILKWQGLRKENLANQGVWLADDMHIVVDAYNIGGFRIDATTCALCEHTENYTDAGDCTVCPFTLANGYDCSGDLDDSDACDGYPYGVFLDTGDPEPMIESLECTLRYLVESNAA